MRIISQDGMIDIPYEQVIVNIDCRNTCRIVAGGVNCIECHPFPMAIYSAEKKAIKAMEMLHREWEDFGETGLFRFPQDEEM